MPSKSVTLLGGEPLLGRNRDLVAYILNRGRELEYAFSIVTNGHDLDRFLDLFDPEVTRFFQVTLDGPRAVHDRKRPRRGGGPSFDRIVDNIGRALERGLRVSVRVNIAADDLEQLVDIARLVQERDWARHKGFDIYFAAIYTQAGDCLVDDGLALSQAQIAVRLDELRRRHPEVAVIKHTASLEAVFSQLFATGKYMQFKGAFCGANSSMYVFDPHGDLYACWESVGRDMSRLGSYHPDLRLDEARHEDWRGRAGVEIPRCLECKYVLLCGGGCTQHAHDAHGDFRSPDCRDFEQVLKLSLPLFYRKYEEYRQRRESEAGQSEEGPDESGNVAD